MLNHFYWFILDGNSSTFMVFIFFQMYIFNAHPYIILKFKMEDKQYGVNIFCYNMVTIQLQVNHNYYLLPNLLPINSTSILINIYLIPMLRPPRICGTYGTTLIVYSCNWYMVNKSFQFLHTLGCHTWNFFNLRKCSMAFISYCIYGGNFSVVGSIQTLVT